MLLLATELRPPQVDGGEQLTRLAVEVGATGIHLGAGCDLEVVGSGPLVGSALRLGLEAPTLALPLPERALRPGKRLPNLSALEPDERDAAITIVENGLSVGMSFGARLALLDFGPVPLAASAAAFAQAFARRAVAEDEPGGLLLAAALAERRARGPEIVDACLWSLERLVRAAERAGLRLAIAVGVTPWQAPSPRELGLLLETFAGSGATLGVAWDPARLSVLAKLDLSLGDDRARALAAAATVAIESDAVGLDAGYLPGLGERDARLSAIAAPAGVPRIVTGAADATDAEVASAAARISAG
jgi:hypothetical protein